VDDRNPVTEGGPFDPGDLSELLGDFGDRWQIQWGEATALGRLLEAVPRGRLARHRPLTARSVAEMRLLLKVRDRRHGS
jgi:hypothetical protein